MHRKELEEEIIALRLQHRFASIKLQNSAEKLDSFLVSYYQSVGDLAQELAGIQDKIADYARKIAGQPLVQTEIAEEEVSHYNIAPREDKLEREVKELYRKIIKTVHPDVCEEKLKAAEYVLMVNQAYNKQRLHQLTQLEVLISDPDTTIKQLTHRRNQLVTAVFELRQQLDAIRDNPVYKLRKKLRMQTDDGQLMIGQIRTALEKRIANTRRDLIDKKLEYLEKIQTRIIA